MQVIAQGQLKRRSCGDCDGIKRTVVELDVDEIGPALRFATVKVTKTTCAPQNDRSSGAERVHRSVTR